MDPVSRREVWDIIERAKKGRVVILTTHSMEEADTLADTIGTVDLIAPLAPSLTLRCRLPRNAAIMAKGQLQCMGSAIHLKKKFGAVRLPTTTTMPPHNIWLTLGPRSCTGLSNYCGRQQINARSHRRVLRVADRRYGNGAVWS
jgi:hypothetical protein